MVMPDVDESVHKVLKRLRVAATTVTSVTWLALEEADMLGS
jgi:hypothetical protein